MLKHRKRWLPVLLLVLLAGAVFVLVQTEPLRAQGTAEPYETEPVRRGDVYATIGASGQVNAAQSATLAWQTSGKVIDIAVEPGQRVNADEILASLDPTSLPAAAAQAQSNLLEARRQLEKLKGSDTPLRSARLALIQSEKDLQAAKEARAALDEPRASKTNLEAAEAGINQAKANLKAAEDAYRLVEGLAEDDPVRLRLSAQVVSARRQLQNAEWNLAYVHSTPTPGEYERADAALNLAESNLEDARREVKRQEDSSNAEITSLQTQIEAAQAILDQRHLVAPFNGTVTELIMKTGDLVGKGTPALRLDDLEDMDVIVQVPEVDINRVETGQPVQLVFDAVPDRLYKGAVQTVARAGETVDGLVRFYVRVHANDLDEFIRPGMTAAVTITVASASDVLIVPNRAVRTINGHPVVYVQQGEQIKPVEISIGISGDVESEVISGALSEGDVIILNPPSRTETVQQ